MIIKQNTKIVDKNIEKRVKNQEVALCLSRHGESEANVDVSVYKHTSQADIKMTLDGKKQIKESATQLCKLFHKILSYPWEMDRFHVYTSPFIRAKESAHIFANELLQGKLFGSKKITKIGTMTTSNLLTEQNYGFAEGCISMEQFAKGTHGEEELLDRLGDYLYAPPRGESRRDVYVRAGLFVEKERWFEGNTFNIVCAHKVTCQEIERYLTGTTTDDWGNAETRIYIVHPEQHKAVNWGIIKP